MALPVPGSNPADESLKITTKQDLQGGHSMSIKIEKATGNEVAKVPAAPEAAEQKYVDPRVGYTPLTVHQRKALAKRRAHNKAARKARKAQR